MGGQTQNLDPIGFDIYWIQSKQTPRQANIDWIE